MDNDWGGETTMTIVAIQDEIATTHVSAPEHVDVMAERAKWLQWLEKVYMPGNQHIATPASCDYISLHDWLIKAGCRKPKPPELLLIRAE